MRKLPYLHQLCVYLHQVCVYLQQVRFDERTVMPGGGPREAGGGGHEDHECAQLTRAGGGDLPVAWGGPELTVM
jgi:hypothetical protein